MAFGNSLVEVGIAIHLRDQFTNKTGQIAGSFRGLMNDIRTAGQMAQSGFSTEIAALGAVAGFGIDSYKEYAKVAKDVFLSTAMIGGAQADYNDLLQQAKEINLEVPLTSKDISSAQRYMAMAGLGLEEITAMTKPVAQLASLFDMTAGGKGGVADILTNIMATYRLGASEVTTTVDDLFTAVTSCNISLEDLGNAIKMAGSEATVSGVSLQETAAAIGLLGDMGIQGTAAGTAIANTFRYLRLSLSGQKEKGFKALQALGLSKQDFYDAQGNLISLHNTYRKFAEAVTAKGLTQDQIGEAFYNIFGVRGERNMLLVMQQMLDGHDKMSLVLNKMQSNEGLVDSTMTQYMGTAQGQLDQLVSNLDYFKQTVGQLMETSITPILTVVNKLFKGFNELSGNPFVGFLIKGTFAATFAIISGMVYKMMISFKEIFFSLRLSASQSNSIANNGQRFANSIQQALNAMMLMQVASSNLKMGTQLPVGNIGGQPAYLAKARGGAVGLHYVDANGVAQVTRNQNQMAGMLMYGTLSGKPSSPPGPGPNPPVSAARHMGGKMMAGMARLGGNILKAIPVVGTVVSMGFLLVDGINLVSGLIKGNTDELQRQREQEQLKQQQQAYRSQAIASLSAAQIQQLRVTGMLEETLNDLAVAIAKGQDINLVINGQRVRQIASDTAIDVTQEAFNSYRGGAMGSMGDSGYE